MDGGKTEATGGDSGAAFWLTRARVPLCLIAGGDTLPADREGLALVDLRIADGAIAAVEPSGPVREGAAGDGPVRDQDGGQVWPCPVDLHTHLDKGHIWPRAENPDGTHGGARATVERDREAHWSAGDVAVRIEFGLRCAYAHGTRAIRTHLDSMGRQTAITWPVFAAARDRWAGRIALQAVSLTHLERLAGPEGKAIADTVAGHGGILGAVTHAMPGLDEGLDRLFGLAAERGLDLDLHVDESGDPGDASLRALAAAALRHRFRGRIVAGHCCSLAVQQPEAVEATLALVAEAGIAVVSLPMCNLYLQDRAPGRTPRWRGVTLLHELAGRGIPVAVASDNCRDPFYGYGDHDMVEVFCETARIAHLDRPVGDWPAAVTTTPAALMGPASMGTAGDGRIAPGRPADLVLFRARHYSELLSRPQSDRVVLRAGRAIDAVPPDYRELDGLFPGGPNGDASALL